MVLHIVRTRRGPGVRARDLASSGRGLRLLSILAGLAALCAIVPAAGPAHADEVPLQLLVFERPPYYESAPNGSFTGLVAGPVARALERAGVPFTWRPMQPNGHLRTVEANTEPVCAVGWFRTPERAAFSRVSAPIYQDRPQVVLTRADNTRVLAHTALRDLLRDSGLRLGAKLGYSYGPEVDALIESLDTPRSTASQDDMGLARMLLGGRFDYMMTAFEEADVIISAFGAAGEDLIALTLADMPPGNTRHLLCSESVDPETMDRINAALVPSRGDRP